MTSDPERVYLYIEALKDAYKRLRRRLRPSFTGLSNIFDKRIEPFAARLVRAGADPYAYMQYVFDKTINVSADVYPNMFLSEKMIERFLEERPKRRASLKLIVEGQAVELKMRLKQGWTLPDILQDPDIPLSAVFRYATAHSEGYPQIAARFEKEAERMLIFEPYYKTLLSPWLPERMRRV